jgi:hypothetical protein
MNYSDLFHLHQLGHPILLSQLILLISKMHQNRPNFTIYIDGENTTTYYKIQTRNLDLMVQEVYKKQHDFSGHE